MSIAATFGHSQTYRAARNDLSVLASLAGRMQVKDICSVTGMPGSTVRDCLRGLLSAGVIRRVKYGIYEIQELK